MSFVRPEVREGLLKWREALIGSALIAIGGYYSVAGLGVQVGLGAASVVIGAALVFEGVRRARFPAPGGGAGVVDVDERQITYFGPLGGGAVSIDELTRVVIRTSDLGPLAPDLYWDFHDAGGQCLTIPGDAEGAAAIFDALSSLSGVNYEAATEAGSSTEDRIFTVWRKPK